MATVQEISMIQVGFAETTLEIEQEEILSDRLLIQKAKDGDVQAFESLFYRYQTKVLNLAFRIVGDQDCAKDVTQETFIRIYHSLKQFKNEKKFFSWLYRITINVCYDFLRKENRFRHSSIDEQVANSTIMSEQKNEKSELVEKIYEMINLLSTQQKTTFILRETEGLKCKEIAKVMECPVGTVRSHLFHARKKLKELMQKNYPELLEGVCHEL